MHRFAVTSTHLKNIGYDARARTLEVEFQNGSVYTYFNIPMGVFFELITSNSKGRYHNRHIRMAYEFRRESGPTRRLRAETPAARSPRSEVPGHSPNSDLADAG